MKSNKPYFWLKMSDLYQKLEIYSQNVSCYNVNVNHIEFLLNARTWIWTVQNCARDGTLDLGWDAAFYTRPRDGKNQGRKVWAMGKSPIFAQLLAKWRHGPSFSPDLLPIISLKCITVITKKTFLILSISINVDCHIFSPKAHVVRLWLREIELKDAIVILFKQ